MPPKVKKKVQFFLTFFLISFNLQLGSIFLDVSQKYGAVSFYQMGEQILTLAVVSILITAPVGALAIMTTGFEMKWEMDGHMINQKQNK